MSRNLYIVPHDFSEAGNTALNYALFLGKRVRTEIMILHLVDNKAKIPNAEQKLEEIKRKAEIPASVEVICKAVVGDIFSDINKIAKQEYAQLIIMGTHGAKGFQKLTGSFAIKVISSCEIPFIIVQKDTKHVDIKDIVVPINLSKESLQIVSPASDIARIFDSTLHIIGEKYADEGLSAQTKNRVLLIRNKCDETHTKCDVNLLPLGGSFSKKIVNYVKEKNINMIAVSYFSESLLPQFDGFAQALITNELNLPCMIISAKQGGNVYF